MGYDNVIVEAAFPLVIVTVNRPKVLNALDDATVRELTEVFAALAGEPQARCVVLTGAGDKAFVAGADIAAMAGARPRRGGPLARARPGGWVNGGPPPADLMVAARSVAEKVASRAPLAVAEAKRAMREGADLPLAQALGLERELFAGLFATADQKEGMRAFLDKRPP